MASLLLTSVRSFCSALILLVVANPAAADEINFELQIRPLLTKHCGSCHGAEIQKSGLRLDAKSFALRGGDGGAVIHPGKPENSSLIERITSADPGLRMPPEGPALPASEIELLRRWIANGAVWPETDYDRSATVDPRQQHWAWQPIKTTQPPTDVVSSNAPTAAITEIDRFILAELSKHQLDLSEPADRRTLIRRLSFDLLGLPPTPEQIQTFVADSDPRAYEKLVDTFLASPHYGERWARHWLDIAHYADTHGFERDQRRDNAWPYRDWVIRAINNDMPYDQFLRDQIAGDALRPTDPDAVIATGFLAAGPWDFVGQAETPSPVLKRLARADDLDDMLTQVMTSACAVTINCARCHDHKLDPISHKEYYSLTSVFAGVRRADRIVSSDEQKQLADRKAELEKSLADARTELSKLRGDGWSLADIVGGGNGRGTGKAGFAVDPSTGKTTNERRGSLESAKTNMFAASELPFIDGVVIPDGQASGDVVISSTGLIAKGIPDTGGKTWDAIRNGPVNSQFSTLLSGVDFSTEGHSLLSLHANAAITFDLDELRAAGMSSDITLRAQIGYFGQTPKAGASAFVLLDGQKRFERLGLGRDDGLQDLSLAIPASVRFLTLMATDHGNDIGHDQICFTDAQLETASSNPDAAKIAIATKRVTELQDQLKNLPEPAKVYATVSETPPTVHVQFRGNPEQNGDEVTPGTISCISNLESAFGDSTLPDSDRRIALANWICSESNPLTRRVIVNRLWHHHFGTGLVDTPSDFGLGGSLPSHPELLDWLAEQFQRDGWSLKKLHRRICLSLAYQQSSHQGDTVRVEKAHQLDSGNRLLWRQHARRIDAESLRDSVLAVSGKLNTTMYGPGYRDFEYKEEYAPVYKYITADKPELWRRSVYRFVVRTTPDQFMATLDCPNAANLTPSRNVTTTSLQALALLNNEFMRQQSTHLAERIRADVGDNPNEQVPRLFQLALGRSPSASEADAAAHLLSQRDLAAACLALLNSNEFVYVD
jgi:hypothetical protein